MIPQEEIEHLATRMHAERCDCGKPTTMDREQAEFILGGTKFRTCGNCTHWVPIEVGGYNYPKAEIQQEGKWENVTMPMRWGYCGAVAEVTIKRLDAKFYVHDASEYMAKLGTREDFGCSEFEAKEA